VFVAIADEAPKAIAAITAMLARPNILMGLTFDSPFSTDYFRQA
jgi:hypothetical protein